MTQQQPEIPIVSSIPDSVSGARRFSHNAMATTFEIFIVHSDTHYAQQAAYTAFDELDRLEAELSRFVENSDISRINTLVANQPLVIGLETFECLQLCARIYADTDGAFDVTIGSLLACWRDVDKTTGTVSEEQLNQARQHTGMHLVKLDEDQHTVQLLTGSVQIDLGGIGKGYALDRMAKLLNHWDIDTALISGGASSVLALKPPPATKGWPITLGSPYNSKQTLAGLCLQNRALSGSGLQKGRHIIDPRTAKPVEGKLAAWASAAGAATSDALSTAFMVMAPEEVEQYCSNHPDTLAMLVIAGQDKDSQQGKILRFGLWEEGNLLKQ